jgi:N-acetylglucosamine-6-phosphate deacetylase
MTTGNEAGLLLTNARLVLADRVIDRGSLLIKAGRIERIVPAGASSGETDVVECDLSGSTLFPGFIDVHIHGAVGVDVLDANLAGLERVSTFLSTWGVTAWLPTLVPATPQQYEESVGNIAALMFAQRECWSAGNEPTRDSAQVDRTTPGAQALGVHYEGPFVSSEQCGALHRDHFRTFSSAADLDLLAALSEPDAIHLMTIAPEIEGGIELVRELVRRGWIVSLGHTRAGIEVLDSAAEAGARHMTHFMNAMAPLHHRAPGPIGWGLLRDDVTCDLIADGVHLDPVMLRLLLRVKTPERLSLISDAIAAAGMGDGDYQIWGETISVEEGRTSNASGSIAGSVITMLDAVRMMLSLGVSEADIARMASLNPARLLRIDTDYGSIAAGKRADLVALGADAEVRMTIVGGRIAHKSTE